MSPPLLPTIISLNSKQFKASTSTKKVQTKTRSPKRIKVAKLKAESKKKALLRML